MSAALESRTASRDAWSDGSLRMVVTADTTENIAALLQWMTDPSNDRGQQPWPQGEGPLSKVQQKRGGSVRDSGAVVPRMHLGRWRV